MTTTTPLVQNFSLPAGNKMAVHFDVNPDGANSLLGASIIWKAFAQQHGIITDDTPVISKVLDAGIQVDDPDLWKFTVTLDGSDSVGLLGNYRHSAKITISGNDITVVDGIMTVTESR